MLSPPINRWNGQMPYVLGGTGDDPFFQQPVSTVAQENQTKP